MTILMDKGFSSNKAEELGIFLGIEKGRIDTLRTNNNGNVDRLLPTIIEEWLRNDEKKSWEKLADAVRRCYYPLLADKILKKYCGEVFQKQQQQSSILTTPVEKMEQTRESNIIYRRTVVSNDSDKEEVLLGKDFTAENNKDVREFSEDLSSGDLYRYLLFKHVPKKDCDIIKEEGIPGLSFLDLSKEDWKDYGLSRAGVIAVVKIQERIKAAQIEPSTSPHISDTLS